MNHPAADNAVAALSDAARRWAHEAGVGCVLGTASAKPRLGIVDAGTVSLAERARVAAAASAALRTIGRDAATGGGTAEQRAAHAEFAAVYHRVVGGVLEDTSHGTGGTLRRMRAPVRGVTFWAGYPDTLLSVADGDVAELRPAPDNPSDPLCVEVHAWTATGAVHIGHLPARRDDVRREIHALAADRDLLGELHVRVSSAHPGRPGCDVSFDLEYDMNLFLRLLRDAEHSLAEDNSTLGAGLNG